MARTTKVHQLPDQTDTPIFDQMFGSKKVAAMDRSWKGARQRAGKKLDAMTDENTRAVRRWHA